jgi:transposase
MQYLVDVLFPFAQVIHVVLDNLNTHTPAALYQTFVPQEVKRILDHLQVHYTPKQGSWLNMIELEFSVLSRQWLDLRIPSIDQLKQKVSAWEETRNQQKSAVNWQYSVSDARGKLKRLYPEPSLS